MEDVSSGHESWEERLFSYKIYVIKVRVSILSSLKFFNFLIK